MYEHEIQAHFLFSKKVGFAGNGMCIPETTAAAMITEGLVTDLQPCKGDCIREIDEKDYEVAIKVTGDPPDDASEEQIPVIKFEKFESAKY